jgi:hypothetical protein
LHIAAGVKLLDKTGVVFTVIVEVKLFPEQPFATGVMVNTSFWVVTPALVKVPEIGPFSLVPFAIPDTLLLLLVQL